MAPRRKYNLGKRAAAVEETKQRVLEAAIDAYTELGIIGTSMQEVARRADVATGTVLYHYKDSDALAREALNRMLESLEIPSVDTIREGKDLRERISILLTEMYAFYQRGEKFVNTYMTDRGKVPALDETDARFNAMLGELLVVAMQGFSELPGAMAMVGNLLNPAFSGGLTSSGTTTDEAAAMVSEMFVIWLERRSEYSDSGATI